ncbi:MAG: HAAS signaling domain-containing protein [Streptosporangiaceae bacterium]
MTSRQAAREADKLIRDYLAQLDAALQGVDASRRQEILAGVHAHIEEGRASLDPDDAVSVRTLLDRVGDPAAIAAEAGAPAPGSRRWDVWAPWLIIFGPVASGLGWVAGVLILWTSPAWSRRDKLIATLVPPVGLVALFFGLVAALRSAAACTGPATTCTTKGFTLPLGVALLLVVAGLAAHLLPPIHLDEDASSAALDLGLISPRPTS